MAHVAGNATGTGNTGTSAGTGTGTGTTNARRDKKLAGDISSTRPLKRRCVSNACIACRRRKSKCDGNTPACAACASVYHTECVYDPNSDHRRKGVYKADIDNLKNQNSTLQTLIEAILNYPEDRVYELVRQIRTCDSLEDLAEAIVADAANDVEGESPESANLDATGTSGEGENPASLEAELSGKLGQLRIEDGQVRFIGATSNLMFMPTGRDEDEDEEEGGKKNGVDIYEKNPITTWTKVTDDPELINHLVTMYFAWHYPYFTTLSKDLFYKEFVHGMRGSSHSGTVYCTPLLVNAMLTLGCHFTSVQGSRANPNDSSTAGDHFFKEAKRLIYENDEHENPRLPTVQALALMSVREAGCGRESKGWVYSGMSFRMAMDLGLHLDPSSLKEGVGTSSGSSGISDEEVDARRVTFWGCYLFDKCWSNYMGRMPQLPSSMVTVPKPDVFPSEDSDNWHPYTDTGLSMANPQPSRIRAVALRITMLCEISNDILLSFYNPTPGSTTGSAASIDTSATIAKVLQQGKNSALGEFKKLGELFTRLEEWRKKLPPELEAKEGSLPSVLLMHMFHQTLYIHLFRPFLKFSAATTSTLSHLDPRKACLGAATTMSKYLRFYKRRYGLRQICNVAGYFIHSACTIHLLNLGQKTAKRDIVQGLKSLEEIGEFWLVAKRALVIVGILVKRWRIELPEEAEGVLSRCWTEGRRFGLGAEVERVLGRKLEKGKKHSSNQEMSPATASASSTPPPSMINIYNTSPASVGSPPASSPAHAPQTQFQPYFRQQQQQQQQAPQPGAAPAPTSAPSPSSFLGPPQQQPFFAPIQQPYLNFNPPSPSTASASTPENTDGFNQDWWYRDQTELASELGVGMGMDWGLASAGVGAGGTSQPVEVTQGEGSGNVQATSGPGTFGGLDGYGNWA